MPLSDFLMENPLGLPILPHLRRQISSRIGDYSGKTSSLYLRQARQSLSLGSNFQDGLLNTQRRWDGRVAVQESWRVSTV